MSVPRVVFAATALGLALWLGAGCSLQNHEGPDVTCADLECGRINACKDGIIAQCVDGRTVRFHVCTSSGDDVCDEDWQVPGQYRCLKHATDCEGCRPEREAGCRDPALGGEGGRGGAGGDGGARGGRGGQGGG